jgi:hypothetical protein
MYACIALAAPQAADLRQDKDQLVPAMVRWEGKYSDQLLETIDWCLCLNHLYRPQSVFALQKALTETPAVQTAAKAADDKPRSWFGSWFGRQKKQETT